MITLNKFVIWLNSSAIVEAETEEDALVLAKEQFMEMLFSERQGKYELEYLVEKGQW